jgi:hypothetical protein
MPENKFPALTGTRREQFILSSADAFKRASLLALESVERAEGAGEKFHLGIVYGVNGAFAVELYLKCLLEIECGQIPATHNLKDLFYQLSRESQAKLKRDHKRIQDNPMLAGFRQRMGIKTDLHSLLEDGQDVFKQFRYMFEGVPDRRKPLGFALEPFGELVRNRILNLRPKWLVDESTSPTH